MSILPPRPKAESKAIGSTRCAYGQLGDPIAIHVNGKWLWATLVQLEPEMAAWGDFQVQLAPNAGYKVRRASIERSPASIIGKGFDSLMEAKDAMRPFIVADRRHL